MALADRQTDFAYTNIATATTTQVKVGTGTLKRIVFNKPVSAGTVSIYDATGSDTSPVIALITSTADLKPQVMDFDTHFGYGLKIVTVQAQDITVVWQ